MLEVDRYTILALDMVSLVGLVFVGSSGKSHDRSLVDYSCEAIEPAREMVVCRGRRVAE
jgi:hypothetical protein